MKQYLKAICTECKFVRRRCATEHEKFIDNNGYMVISHMAKTQHIMELQNEETYGYYKLINAEIIQLKKGLIGERTKVIKK